MCLAVARSDGTSSKMTLNHPASVIGGNPLSPGGSNLALAVNLQ